MRPSEVPAQHRIRIRKVIESLTVDVFNSNRHSREHNLEVTHHLEDLTSP